MNLQIQLAKMQMEFMSLTELQPDEMEKAVNNFRAKRVGNKAIENLYKKSLLSPDIVDAGDFFYESFTPLRRDGEENGDSGSLYIATHKSDASMKYVIKHAMCDCAANEFVYSKLARGMGLKMPDVKLFRLSDPLGDTFFKTEYVCGIEYLNIVDQDPSLEIINLAKNAADYYKLCTLHKILRENDSLQVVLANDGYIYRIDASDAFCAGETIHMFAGITPINGNGLTSYSNYSAKGTYGFSQLWDIGDIDDSISLNVEMYGADKLGALMEPLYAIRNIRKRYIDSFLETLCFIYPELAGYYYGAFLVELKRAMKRITNMFDRYDYKSKFN